MASDAELIAEFIGARTEHRAHTPPSERQGQPLSLAEAYRLQDVLRDALVRRGETVTGWKAGFTNRGAQDAYQVSEPVCAFLLASSVLPSGAEVPVARFTGLAVEAEVAFVMGRDLAGPGVTASAAADAVKGAQPALELVDFRYTGKALGTDVIAEGVFAKSVVLAGALTPIAGLDLALEGLVWEQSGRIMATNTAAEVMGNPLNSSGLDRQPSGLPRSHAQGGRPGDDRLGVRPPAPEGRRDGPRALHPAGRRLRALRVMRAHTE